MSLPAKSSPRLTGIPGGLALNDGLMNVVTGAGTDRDRNVFNRWALPTEVTGVTLDDGQIDAAYLGSWMVRKAHDIIPEDMTAEWRTWNLPADQISKVENEEKRLGIRDKVREALRLGRLRGGAALILGLPGNPKTEVVSADIGVGGVRYVLPVTKRLLRFEELDWRLVDERGQPNPYFGQPRMFYFTPASTTGAAEQELHPSRVIVFPGLPSPEGPTTSDQDRLWGRPLLEALNEALQNAAMSQSAGAAMMPTAITKILKIPGLTDMVSTAAGEQRLGNRLRVAQMMQSIWRAYVVDGGNGQEGSGEDVETSELSFTNIPEMMMALVQFVCAGIDVPATRFLGTSPKGLNSTGEGENKDYRAKIRKDQNRELRPKLERLDMFVLPSAGVKPDKDATWTFSPLDQKTGKEQAEEDKLRAEAIKIVKETGLVQTDALAQTAVASLAESPNFPGLVENVAASKEPLPAVREAEEATMMGEAKVKQLTTPAGQVKTKTRPRDSIEDASKPRTLYVSRKVLNPQEVLNHYRGQGLGDVLVAAGDLHVTIIWSKTPVDWMKLPASWNWSEDGKMRIAPGGPRTMELFGPLNDTLVLAFQSQDLQWRHADLREAGIEWDWDDYQPHITLAKVGVEFDVDAVTPYRGRIVLGPEVFAEVEFDQAEPEPEVAEG